MGNYILDDKCGLEMSLYSSREVDPFQLNSPSIFLLYNNGGKNDFWKMWKIQFQEIAFPLLLPMILLSNLRKDYNQG